MSDLPKSYDPKAIEAKWYSFWQSKGFFQANNQSDKPPFSIVIPPPNVTGVLHMGHALVDTIQDILIRQKRMQGFETLWLPGTDHAGIATQSVVERSLMEKTGKRRRDFSREEFLRHVWEWKEKSEERILAQVKKLGCSCDWSRLRFTMDEGCNRAVRMAFCKMYNDQLIYQGDYLVHWDPVTQTALSDDEVEYEEKASHLWFLRYPVENTNQHLVVATTRPETMLGDTAVAVHPDDERYKHLIGRMIRLPLTNRLIPIIGDAFVDPEFGTGAVKITPAHDFNDYEMAQRHNLEMMNIMEPNGKINEKGRAFANLSMQEAREKVVDALKELDCIEKIEPYTLRIGISYRSKAIIEPYLSKQWFVKMSVFKDKLLSAVREKRVHLVPPHWQATYEHWIEHLRDWCISRQLWWGHRIPIWHDREDPTNKICFDGEGVPPEVQNNPDRYVQDPDVLDTWFSSALWPFATLGWPNTTDDLKKFYPTSTLITGHDILFFWVARMILMSEYIMEEIPFQETFLHGLIYGKSYWKVEPDGTLTYAAPEEKKRYDLGETPPPEVESKWEKMSKSKGNVIDPIEIIEEYGTDATRMALCSSVTHARQIDLDRRRFEEFKNFANKVWNGSRFVLMNLRDLSSESLQKGIDRDLLTLEDQWMLSTLNRTIADLNRHLKEYTFDRAAMRAYEFFWNDFCALYVELCKPVLFGKIGLPSLKENKQKLLTIVLSAAIRLLHPITPFITEEIFSLLQQQFPELQKEKAKDPYTEDLLNALHSPACMVAPYPKVLCESDISPNVEVQFEQILQIVHAVRKVRAEMQLPPSEKTELFLFGAKHETDWQAAQSHQTMLLAITHTSRIHFVEREKELPKNSSSVLVGTLKLVIPIPESLQAKEKQRLEKELLKLEKQRDHQCSQLNNPSFCEKAPKELVQKLQETLAHTEKQIASIKEKLN